MKIDIIDSRGKDNLEYHTIKKADPTDGEIEIRTKLCGICRSDIAVYAGWEDPIPFGHFGHEGIGTVTKVGKNIKNVKEGDFVATISDPAYGTYYNAKENEFIKIPELSKKYIIQPVACATNIINKTLNHYYKNTENDHTNSKILMFGTGFMSMIIGQLIHEEGSINLTVVGNSHREFWKKIGFDLKSFIDDKYPIIMDLSSNAKNFYKIPLVAEKEALITMASTPFSPVTTNFFQNSWNCHTFIFPSPRNLDFHDIMNETVELIENNIISPEKLWTKKYSFNDAETGFEEGINRTTDYIRGYIEFE